MGKIIIDLSRVYKYEVSNISTTGRNVYTLYSKTGENLDRILKTVIDLNFAESNVIKKILNVDAKQRNMIKLSNVISSEVLK